MSKVLFIGDVMLGRRVPELLSKPLFNEQVIDILSAQDCIIANLEAPFASNSDSNGFYVDEQMVHSLGFINAVSLANNHIFDQGTTGFELTKKVLKESKISFFGIKEDPYYIFDSDKDKKMLIVGCIDISIVSSKSEEEKELYKSRLLNLSDKKEILQLADKFKEFTKVLYVHAGDEFIPLLKSQLIEKLRYYSEIGFDYIMITHPHVVGGKLILNNRSKVYYSLGDFIFDGDSYLRMHSYGVVVTMGAKKKNREDLLFFRRENNRIFLRFDKNLFQRVRFSFHSFLSKRIFRNVYSVFFWIYMILYQLNRIRYSIIYSGLRTTLKTTLQRVSLLKYYMK